MESTRTPISGHPEEEVCLNILLGRNQQVREEVLATPETVRRCRVGNCVVSALIEDGFMYVTGVCGRIGHSDY